MGPPALILCKLQYSKKLVLFGGGIYPVAACTRQPLRGRLNGIDPMTILTESDRETSNDTAYRARVVDSDPTQRTDMCFHLRLYSTR